MPDSTGVESQPPQSAQERRAATSASVHFEKERGVSEITVRRGLAHATVPLPGSDLARQRLDLLKSLAAASVPVFMVKLHPGALSFAVREDEVEACEQVLRAGGVVHALKRDLGLVTTHAGAMRDLSGVMACIYETLVAENIRVEQTGDAYNAVLCLVAGDKSERAAERLRKAFALPEPGSGGGESAATPEGVGLKAL